MKNVHWQFDRRVYGRIIRLIADPRNLVIKNE